MKKGDLFLDILLIRTLNTDRTPATYAIEMECSVSRKAKYVSLALLLMMVAYEVVLFIRSTIAENKARKMADLVATLMLGYTTRDSAVALFQTHNLFVTVDGNACSIASSTCEDVFVGVSTYSWIIFNRVSGLGMRLDPLPPIKPAGFGVNLYFINGILDSIHEKYDVGMTTVAFSKFARASEVRTSEWKYADGGLITRIGVASSGAALDGPFPQFDFKYMYSMKCTDARMLWPSAPPPTIELHGWPGCR